MSNSNTEDKNNNEHFLSTEEIHPAALENILNAREERVNKQFELINKYALPIISFTMNIPGEIKCNRLIEFAFNFGINEILSRLSEPVHFEKKISFTGCEAFFVYNLPPYEIKKFTLTIEGESEIGRLFDIDVIDKSGNKLSRDSFRKCLICDKDAFICARERAHSLDELKDVTGKILTDFAASYLSKLTHDALLSELRLTPKPGLVDMNNNGAHTDMDFTLMTKSIEAITPYFKQCSQAVVEALLVEDLIQIGLDAEGAMYNATKGVNTHKGAIYSFMILISAITIYLISDSTTDTIFDISKKLSKQIEAIKRTRITQETHGNEVYKKYSIPGATGEALSGFENARCAARLLNDNSPLDVLLYLMANVDDSNIYYRGGKEGANYIKEKAKEILESPEDQRIPLSAEFDKELIRRNISPGGCADILALSIFIHKLYN